MTPAEMNTIFEEIQIKLSKFTDAEDFFTHPFVVLCDTKTKKGVIRDLDTELVSQLNNDVVARIQASLDNQEYSVFLLFDDVELIVYPITI